VNIVFAREAVSDLERLRNFLYKRNPDAAARAMTAIGSAIYSMGTFPERGRPSSLTGARELIVSFGRSAYVLRYAHLSETNEVVVLRVWHGREQRE
jgi:plasmid stabilization system protein ParE